MKKTALFLFFVSQIIGIVACQKKQYAYFQSSPNQGVVVEKKIVSPKTDSKVIVITTQEINIEKPIEVTASTSNDLDVIHSSSTDIATNVALNIDNELVLKKVAKKTLVEKRVERVIERKMTKLAKTNHHASGSGWNSLNSTLKLGILLILASILIGLIPFLGWLLGGIVGLIGVILLLWGILIQIS